MDAFWLALADALGSVFGKLMIVPLYILFWAVVWGFWTERILSKARFIGFRFWLLFGLLNLIWLVIPLIPIVTIETEEVLAGIAVLAFWLGIILFAVLPWPIRVKSKAKPPTKINPN